ncbi:MAG: hypothetical protein CFE44_01355 [Burkholderiales bacterium PBB4]|nr:MAG: hypothetical protein CFE44_01355 [Burkholderiales bacterium PBB4]
MSFQAPSLSGSNVRAKLMAITALVLLAHGGLLYGTPMVRASHSTEMSAAFSTRMLSPPAPLLPALPLVDASPADPRPSPRKTIRQAPVGLPAMPTEVLAPQDAAGDGQDGPSPAERPHMELDELLATTPQLLGASGPPANLTPSAVVKMAAAADTTAGTSPPGATGSGANRAPPAKGTSAYAMAPSAHLKYAIQGQVRGFDAQLKGELQWLQDGKNYEAKLTVSHFLLGSRVQTSRGELGSQGLEPVRFGDKFRSERAAHFDRVKGKVTFSANTPDGVLSADIQDQLSVTLQLAAMLAGAPQSFPEGTMIPFDVVGATSVESWVFKVGTLEKLTLPGGTVSAIKLSREAVGTYGTRGEVWLAPSMAYLPVRIRLVEANGDVMDQRWSETVTP